MKMRTIVATLCTAGLLSGALSYALDTEAHAGTTETCTPGNGCTKVVGSLKPSQYWFAQRDGDCEEGAADVVIGAVKGARLKETTIDAYAKSAGILLRDGTHYGTGSNWFGPDGIVKLLKHYDVNSHTSSSSVKTIETALKAGHKVIAFVNAETIWSVIGDNTLFGPPPAGEVYTNVFTPGTQPDHTVTIDEINETAGTVTLTDTGNGYSGAIETVPLSVFKTAYATSGYQVDITG